MTSVPMPKKFASVNTKAVEARERKENAKSSKALESKKAAEDAAWEDDDKMANKKALKKVCVTVFCHFSRLYHYFIVHFGFAEKAPFAPVDHD